MTRIDDRIQFMRRAADTLSNTGAVLQVAAEAISTACGRGLAFVFLPSGLPSDMAAAQGGVARQPGSGFRPRWIVNIERVPLWQQNRWIEPMHAGIHGPAYFQDDHPASRALHGRPDYGRAMICAGGRMIAWAGLFVDSRQPFNDRERAQLGALCEQIVGPMRVAALLAQGRWALSLSRRQHEILSRVALGWTNKRIARDLDISAATVKTVLERLYRRSGCANRAALVARYRNSVGPSAELA